MCISILSSAHPDYPFILLSNRDEYISRPTLRANWWDPPHQQVLGGRDTQRAERGTWLGITKQGRIAILTNFREEGVEVNKDKSRGAITNSYLCVPPESHESEEEYVRRLLEEVGIHDVGGFTLIFGKLRKSKGSPGEDGDVVGGHASSTKAVSRLNMLRDHQSQSSSVTAPPPSSSSSSSSLPPGLAIISNRTSSPSPLPRILTSPTETHGLSNSHFGDLSWPKVVHGEQFLRQAIRADIQRHALQEHLITSLFDILCVDTLPRRQTTEDWDAYVRHMRNSIMISPAKGELGKKMAGYVPRGKGAEAEAGSASPSGKSTPDCVGAVDATAYGTSKQTVILVNREGKVVFTERTLYTQDGAPVPEKERAVRYEFQIEGWEEDS